MQRKWLLALVPATLLVAACGPAQQGGSPAQTSASAGSTTPKTGGVVRTWITTDPEDWDTSFGGKSIPNQYGVAMAYESLMGYKSGPDIDPTDRELRPELAEQWEVSPDGRTYTFHLRQGVKWANVAPVNGRPLTAEDVKWSYEYASRTGWAKDDKKLPVAQFGWMFEGLDKITTPDPSTVVISFKEPFAPFLSYVASDYNPIMPHEIYDKDGNFQNQIAGTGPFQLDMGTTQKGTRWSFKKNPTYWDAGKPYLDEVRMLVLPDAGSAIAAFQTKQIDLLTGDTISNQTAEELKRNYPAATAVEWLRPNPMHFYMNLRKQPLDDIRIRKAIAETIDPDEFIKVLWGGKGGWALAGAFPDTFTQEEIRQIQHRDVNDAKRLVQEAGFPNGVELEFLYPGNAYGDSYITSMQLLQAQLKQAGINLSLKAVDKQVESNRKKSGDYVVTHTNKSLEADVDSYLSIFLPDSKSNYGGVNDPKLTEMVLAQRREPDPAKRRELVRQAVRYIYDNVYALALYYGSEFEFWQPNLKNYNHNVGVNGWGLTESWLE